MIVLYRKGSTHLVRGVSCELKNFNASELTDALADGWNASLPVVEEKLQEKVLEVKKTPKKKKK